MCSTFRRKKITSGGYLIMKTVNLLQAEQALLMKITNKVHAELKDKYEGLFGLDTFPQLELNYGIDTSKPRQQFCDLGYRVDRNDNVVEAVVPDRIMVQLFPTYVLMKQIGCEQFPKIISERIMSEFVKSLMVYQLIKAYEIKYTFDRFQGDEIKGGLQNIFVDLYKEENQLSYYKRTVSFMREKEGVVPELVSQLLIILIEFLELKKTGGEGFGEYWRTKALVASILQEILHPKAEATSV